MGDTDDRFGTVPDHGGVRGLEPSFVDVDGTRTRYYDEGDGDPLVLLHGGLWSGSSNANTWGPAIEPLAREFRVLAPDRIGCGMTDNPDDAADYRFGTELDHALAFLDVMDLGTCHLAGASRGAGLATRMVVEDPARFEALFLTNSHTFGPAAGDRAHRARRLFRGRDDLDSTDPELARFRYEQFSHDTDHVTDEFCRADAYMRSLPKAEETAAVVAERGESFEATVRKHVAETHRRLRDGVSDVPTLYVYGRDDVTVPLGTATGAFELLSQGNPNVRLEVLPRCGHVPFRERPEEFAHIVSSFVDRWP